MALTLKISIEENCDSFYTFDCTGKYDKTCNKTGWGAPNTKISDVVAARFDIYPPGQDVVSLDVYPDFPSDIGAGYEILPEDVGQMDKFTSGVWKVDYLLELSTGGSIVAQCYALFTNDVDCCISKKKLNIDVNNFESKEVVNSNNLIALLDSARENFCLGRKDKAQKIIEFLYSKCKCNC